MFIVDVKGYAFDLFLIEKYILELLCPITIRGFIILQQYNFKITSK